MFLTSSGLLPFNASAQELAQPAAAQADQAASPKSTHLSAHAVAHGTTVDVSRLGPASRGQAARPLAPLTRSHHESDAQGSAASNLRMSVGPVPADELVGSAGHDGQAPTHSSSPRRTIAAPSAPAAAPVPAATILVIDSTPGDSLGQGLQQQIAGASASVTTGTSGGGTPATPNDVFVRFDPNPPSSAFLWTLEFAAPLGQALAPGTYANAVQPGLRGPGQPGLLINSLTANCVSGSGFTVEEISVDSSGNLLTFAATWAAGCGAPAYGELRYNSTVGFAGRAYASNAVSFGSVPVGPPAPPQSLTLTSNGSLPYVIKKGTFTTAPAPNSFAVTGGTCVSGSSDVTVAPGSSCTVLVTTDTSAVITPSAAIQWQDNSARAGGTVAVSATFTGTATVNVALSIPAAGGGQIESSPSGIHCYKQTGFLGINGTCSGQFVPGHLVTLTATPFSVTAFTGWTASVCSGTGTCAFSPAASSTSVTGNFKVGQVTVGFTGGGGGVMTSTPSGINCTAPGFGTCGLVVTPGDSVTLHVVPDAVSVLSGWSGVSCPGTGDCTFNPAAGTTAVTADIETDTVGIGAGGNGSGAVTSTPAGISCTLPAGTGTCSAKFLPGSSVHLSASPSGTSTFTGWSGPCTGTGTCIFTAAAGATTATATFQTARVLIAASGTGAGTFGSTPSGITCSYANGSCTGSYSVSVSGGTQVTLTATPGAGSLFAGWGAPCSGTGPCVFNAALGDTTVTAHFETVGPALGTLAGTANLTSPTTFAGRADLTGGACGSAIPCLEPPDPWLAVGPSHVVQTTNVSVRMTSRTGAFLNEVSLASFFAEEPNQVVEGDPHIVWDGLHGRWIGSEMSADCGTGYLYVAISNTADPTATWTVYEFSASGLLFDFPGLGLSSDKVAVSFNLYGPISCVSGFTVGSYQGADFVAVDATTLVAHPVSLPYANRGADTTIFTWRPALALSSGSDLSLVVGVGSGFALHVGYARLTGTIAANNLAVTAITDLTNSSGVPSFADPPTPIAFGTPDTPPLDGRPTDAVMQGGKLWFVSGIGCVPSGDARPRSCIRLTSLAPGPSPTVLQDFAVGQSGFDVFEGGIGLNGQGAMGVVWSQSSASSPGAISTMASYRLPGDPAGQLRTPITVTAGAGTYAGARWGDFVGVAMDPVDPRGLWEADEVSTASGDWRTQVARLSIDPGPVGTVSINAGASTATSHAVSLTATATDDLAAVTSVHVSNDPGMAGASTFSYGAAIPWNLATGDGSRTVYVQWQDALGNVGPIASDSIVVDTLPPTVTNVAATPVAGATIGTTASVRLTWTAADAGSGITKYEVWLSSNGGSTYALVSSPTSASYVRSLTISSTTIYRYRVRAFDKVGHVSAFVYGSAFHVKLVQQSSTSVHYSTPWSLGSSSSASGGSYRYTSTINRYATYTFSGSAIAMVAYKGSTLGGVRIYIDGVYKGIFSEYSSSTVWKRILVALSVTPGTHTIKVLCAGTSGRPRVDLDAFIVLG